MSVTRQEKRKGNQKYFQKQFLEFLDEERAALENGTRILNNLPKPPKL